MKLSRNGLPSQLQLVSVPAKCFKGIVATCHQGIGIGSSQFDSSNCQFDSGTFPDRRKGGTVEFASLVFSLYDKVVAAGLPNFLGVRIPVPSNLNLKAWKEMALTPEDLQVVAFLTYGFLAGTEGPIHSLSLDNNASAKAHPHN